MSKQEFLAQLRKGLCGLPQDEIEERLTFYGEMIDDRIEEGISEEEAVSEIGSVDDVVSQIITEIPFAKIVKDRIKPKRAFKTWEIVLLALGSPIWLSLLIAAFAVVFSAYAVLWTLIICLWAVFVSVVACSVGCALSGVVFALQSKVLTGIAMIGAGIFCAGLSVFLFFGCKAATKGILLITKKLAVGIKNRFVKKEEA